MGRGGGRVPRGGGEEEGGGVKRELRLPQPSASRNAQRREKSDSRALDRHSNLHGETMDAMRISVREDAMRSKTSQANWMNGISEIAALT